MSEKEETFLVRMVRGGRVTVPVEVRERLGLNVGDFLRIRIKKVNGG